MTRTRGAWPCDDDLRRPFDDETLDPSGWRNYRGAGGPLTQPAYLQAAAHFLGCIREVRAGRAPFDAELTQQAVALGLTRSERNERPRTRPPRVPPLPDTDLARITADLCPSASTEAADRFLGPLADELDGRPGHRKARLVALASLLFSVIDGADDITRPGPHPGFTPFERWCKRRPVASPEIRASARAVGLAPLSVYSLEANRPEGWVVADRLDLMSQVVPDGPVDVSAAACLWRPPQPGDTLVARLVPTDDGWVACNAFILPSAPPPQKLAAWVQLALWEARIRERRLKVEELLRRNAHWLCRHIVEWTWQLGDDHPYRDGVLYDLEYDDQIEDIRHYVQLAKNSCGPVLELGCGTGRLTLPLARAGLHVHGIDLSPHMLRQLTHRLADETEDVKRRIRVWQGDFEHVVSDTRYPLIIWPFNALHHCREPEQLHAVLDRVSALLLPDGVLAIDCYLPDVGLYDRDPDQQDEPRTFTDPRTGTELSSWEQGWWDARLQVHHVIYSYKPQEGPTAHTHLQLRMYTLGQLHRAFQTAGWHIQTEAQDFEHTPIGPGALKWVGSLKRAVSH